MPSKEYSKKEIQQLIEDNKRLSAENESMQKILQSKRFRYAEKIANTYNVAFPAGSVRRKVLSGFSAPSRIIRKRKETKTVKKIENLIEKYDKIVVMHSIPWNTPLRQRPHHLARCLADKGVMVIYLEPDEPIKSVRFLRDNFVTINNWKILFQLKVLGSKDYYFFFNNVSNIPFSLIQRISNHGFKLVYEYIDEFHEDIAGSLMNQLETWKKLKTLKPHLVLASANKLFDEARKHFASSTKVILSKNAVILDDFDYRNYTNTEIPGDLADIVGNGKPIVGYYGALAPWLNYELISKVAIANPSYNFVLLGVNYQNALNMLDQSLKNVYYLGPKKYSDLPKYSSRFDCAIIPFKLGEIAKGTSPVKLFEYMAMGLPTVGTRDLNECKGYEYVYLAKNSDEFSEMVKMAIREHKKSSVRKRLYAQAAENTWEKRAEDIIKVL